MGETQLGLIDELAADLRPVRAIRPAVGLLLTAFAVLATILAVALVNGLRAGLAQGQVSVFFLIANGLLLLLGISAAVSTVAMANPGVGNRHEGPAWAMAMAAVFPLATLLYLAFGPQYWLTALGFPIGAHCFGQALAWALLTAIALFVWVRRGAPVSLRRAGFHLGVAAGALGSLAYGLSCPVDTIFHLAIWHFLPVACSGLLGLLFIPRLIRW